MQTIDSTIEATEFLDETGKIVASAQRLAAEVNFRLNTQRTVVISFKELVGISSSYFNTLLLAITEAHGVGAITDRVTFTFASEPHRQIFQRSRDAVIQSVSQPH